MESLRLEALRSYKILDTGRHPSFDAIVEAASLAFDVPIAAISLVDEDRQWFKAAIGLQDSETERSRSFCTHAIERIEPLVVEDVRDHPLFADLADAMGGVGIRFYAGAPLIDHEGFALGTLCVADTRPRSLGPAQIALLKSLAEAAMTAITAHHQGRLLRQAAEALETCCPREPVFI